MSALLLSTTSVAYVYLVGGLTVPLFAFLFARLQGVRFRELRSSDYFSLVVMASAITPICLPVSFAVAHAAYAKFLIGFGFLFWWTDHALTAVGFLSALVSIVAAVAVHRAAKHPQAAYQDEAR